MLETRVNLNNLDLPTYINTEFIHILAHTFQHHEKSPFGNEEDEEDQLFWGVTVVLDLHSLLRN